MVDLLLKLVTETEVLRVNENQFYCKFDLVMNKNSAIRRTTSA